MDLQHGLWEERCASRWENDEGCGTPRVHPSICWDSPRAEPPCAPHSSLGSSPAAWEAVKVSSKVVVSSQKSSNGWKK